MLSLYRRVFEELLAVPVIEGVKSEKEKFAGALYTTTVEGFIPTIGRGIQSATSHCLGQNFSRPEMFNIFVEDPNDTSNLPGGKNKIYAWQTSWGISTRSIGAMVMTHGDNQGLVLPPRVACIQVIVVPCGITAKTTDEGRGRVNSACEELAETLVKAGIRAKADLRDGYTPGYKFNDWEQKVVENYYFFFFSGELMCFSLRAFRFDLRSVQTTSPRHRRSPSAEIRVSKNPLRSRPSPARSRPCWRRSRAICCSVPRRCTTRA
jgi:hypothetical protein